MLRKLRGKLATSISVIEEGEDFLHNSWLRVPTNDSVAIGKISSRLLDTSYITFSFENPFLSKLFFKLGKTTLYPEDLNYLFGKIKTNTVFFQLLHVASKIINYSGIKPKSSNRDVGILINLQEPTDYLFRLAEPDIKDYLQNLKTNVEKIELLNMKDFLSEGNETVTKEINVRSFGKLKVNKLKIEKVYKIPKLNEIKVPGIGKYKTTVSTFDFQPLKIATVSEPLSLNFTQPSISSQSSSSLSTETINFDAGDVPKAFHVPGAVVDDVKESTNKSEEITLSQESEEITLSQESEEITLSQDSEEITISQESEEITISQVSEEITLSQESEELEPIQENEDIKPIQKTSHKVAWEKRRDPEIILNKFEEVNARFLAENNRAFFSGRTWVT